MREVTPDAKSIDAALFWINRLFLPVPVKPRSKKPYNPDDPEGRDWQNLRITAETAGHYFNGAKQNIGVLLGDDYGSADVDLDCGEAVSVAAHLLPETGLKFGRTSKPASHWFYRVDPPTPSLKLTDPVDHQTLVELRCRDKDGSVGHQTVVPPSIHESGESIRFEPGFDGHPANVDAEQLQRAVKAVAAAAVLARHWPQAGGGRHDAMLALAGVLERAGWSEEDAVRLCLAVYRSVRNHDPDAITRTESEVRDTFRNAAEGRATTGIPTLFKLLDKRVIKRVLDWLQVGSGEKPNAGNLIVNQNGHPMALLANAVTVLRSHAAWSGVLAFNEFSLAVHAIKPAPWGHTGIWTDHEDRVTTDWLQRHCEINLGVHVVAEAVQVVAKENSFDPVREYFDGLVWDGVKRIEGWLSLYLGAAPTAYTAAVGERWLISAVARVYKPGCKADCVLILEGCQGLGKSRALRILGEPWFTDEIADLGSKDAALQLLGVLIVEIAELDSMTRAEVSRVKSFLSRPTDRFRPPYGRRLSEQPRRCVFAGTVNASDYLRDETGNRRFWPVRCAVAKLVELQRDRDQLWAEAVHRFRQDAFWWLDERRLVQDAEQEQADRLQHDPWHGLIENFLAGRDDVSTAEILSECITKDKDRWERKDEMRIGAVLRVLRWERYKQRLPGGGNKSERRYRRPDD
jgi:predicted P-loop ATPase